MSTNVQIVNELFEAIAYSAAKRIAKLAQEDSEAAAREYQQHISAMSEDEKEDFRQWVIYAAAMLETTL